MYLVENPMFEYSGYCYKQQSGNIKILSEIKGKLGKKGREMPATGN
jgi:hypothetical protein